MMMVGGVRGKQMLLLKKVEPLASVAVVVRCHKTILMACHESLGTRSTFLYSTYIR